MAKHELERVELLLGKDSLDYLRQCTVFVAGVGGVGSYAIEALARTGIGHLIILDKDSVEITNLNRQIMATYDTIDKPKTEVMKERIHSYNKNCEVTCIDSFLNEENLQLLKECDFALDAIDTVTSKLDFIEACHKEGIPFISSLGMANRLDPSLLEVRDLYKTEGDPLARSVRNLARKRNMAYKIPVVFSKEVPFKQNEIVNPDGKTQKEKTPPASTIFVPAAAGLLMASYCIRELLKHEH